MMNARRKRTGRRYNSLALAGWENEGGAVGGDSVDHHYGHRIEADRSWTIYHVFTGVPAQVCGNAMIGLSRSDATTGILQQSRGIDRSVFLLGGFALENAIKAFLVYENPQWVSNGRLSRHLKSHSLTALQAKSELVPYKKRHISILRAFEGGLDSWFRYPCALTVGTIAVLTPAPAHAFIFGSSIVFDPTNYGENVLSAARALEQINNQILSLQNEATMLLNQARNLTSLPTSLLSDIQANHTRMQMLLRQAERLAYDVQSIEQTFQQSYSGFAAGQTDAQLIDTARARWKDSVQAFEHALQVGAGALGNIEESQAQTGRLVDASQSAVGALQAVQAGNQLIAVQSQQLSDLTALLAAQGRADAIEQARYAAEYEQAQEQFSRFMASTPYQPQTVRMFGN